MTHKFHSNSFIGQRTHFKKDMHAMHERTEKNSDALEALLMSCPLSGELKARTLLGEVYEGCSKCGMTQLKQVYLVVTG